MVIKWGDDTPPDHKQGKVSELLRGTRELLTQEGKRN